MKEKSIFSDIKMRDYKEAFNNAKNKGLKNPEDYMYMNSSDTHDYFKHIDTRNYIEFKISKESLKAAPVMTQEELNKSEESV